MKHGLEADELHPVHLLHRETTEKIIGAAFEVHQQLGSRGDGCVMAEIKVAPEYDKSDEAQLLNELKATGMKVGVVVNFGRTKAAYKRLVF